MRSKLVLIAAAALVALGCASNKITFTAESAPINGTDKTSSHRVCGVALYNTTDAQAKIAKAALSQMRPNVIARINYIEAVTSRNACKEFRPTQSAHCHPYDQIIHILTGYFDESRLWHESTHAWHQTLEKQDSAFSSKWLAATGDGLTVYKNDGRTFPSKGVITRYGTNTHFEDVAEWVEQIYCFKCGMENQIAKIKDKDDPRYMQKLELLLEYEFIGQTEFNLVKAELLNKAKEEIKSAAVKIPFPIFGADANDLKIISEAVGDAPRETIYSVPSLYVFKNDPSHHFDPRYGAHTHLKDGQTVVINGEPFVGDGRICILKKFITEEIIRHEMAHAHENSLTQEKIEEWINFSGIEAYGSTYTDKNISFPYRGILIRDGAQNYSEDIGYWVGEILRLKNGLWCSFKTGKIDWGNGVYLKKLKFLRDKKFITEDEFVMVLELIKK